MSLHNGDGNGHLDLQVVTLRDAAPLALRPRDAAKAIGISERSLWQRTRDGEIPFVKIGSRTLYRVDALKEYLESLETRADAPTSKAMATEMGSSVVADEPRSVVNAPRESKEAVVASDGQELNPPLQESS